MRLPLENVIAIDRILLLLCLTLILPGCDETPSQGERSLASKAQNAGFEASITGSYRGEVSGTGVLMLLPEAGFEHQGYFFLSDGRGIRAHGVTFVLPRGLAPGRHTLKSPSPFDIGTVPSVRVDRDMGDSVLHSETNTAGFLEVTAFPPDENNIAGANVAGSFEFETENAQGEKIQVKGSFDFTAQ